MHLLMQSGNVLGEAGPLRFLSTGRNDMVGLLLSVKYGAFYNKSASNPY